MDGERVARNLGYDTFEAFLQSTEMASRVIVADTARGAPLYKVYPAKADLGSYVTQQLSTDHRNMKYDCLERDFQSICCPVLPLMASLFPKTLS